MSPGQLFGNPTRYAKPLPPKLLDPFGRDSPEAHLPGLTRTALFPELDSEPDPSLCHVSLGLAYSHLESQSATTCHTPPASPSCYVQGGCSGGMGCERQKISRSRVKKALPKLGGLHCRLLRYRGRGDSVQRSFMARLDEGGDTRSAIAYCGEKSDDSAAG